MNKLNEEYIPEVNPNDINLKSFEPQDELNPLFWVNGKLNSDVRIQLLQIAYDFMDETEVTWVVPDDVVLTGSIANYNWSNYSDVDLHILIDYAKVWDNIEFVEDYFKGKKELWSQTHPNLKMFGFPVEVYAEDTNSPATSTGVYSLMKNYWLSQPKDFEDVQLNADYIKEYTARIETKIDDIIDKMEYETNKKKLKEYSKALEDIFDRLKNIRKESLRKSGEMGSGNIIWKLCRRMGYLDKLWDYVNLTYDKSHSVH